MRIVVLARIHANLPALKAVLDDLRGQSYDALWCIGDWISYGPHPAEVMEHLMPLCTLGVIGQGDLAVLRCADADRESEELLSTDCWTYHQLNQEQRRYLRLLSTSLRFTLQGRQFLLAQTPGSGDDGEPRPDLPVEAWLRLFQKVQAEVLVLSSGAAPFIQRLGEMLCINVGAAGSFTDGRAEARYAWLDVDETGVRVELRQVPYAVAEVWEACRAAGIPEFPSLITASTDPAPRNDAPSPPEDNDVTLDRRLVPVLDLIRTRGPNTEEDEQERLNVSHLALQLFDQLQPLHHLGREERFWLECAALLHTLGRDRHPRSYPRRALPVILNTPLLPFDTRERLLIGSLVRYQRRRPRKKDQNYALLKPEEQSKVEVLSALLRLALALARNTPAVTELYLDIGLRKIRLKLISPTEVTEVNERGVRRIRKRGKYLARLLGRKFRAEWPLEDVAALSSA